MSNSSSVAIDTSATVRFIETAKGKDWLQTQIRKTYGAKIAAEAKAAARAKAIAKFYGLKKAAEAKAVSQSKKIAAYYAEKKAA